jgi:hypothetical protein
LVHWDRTINQAHGTSLREETDMPKTLIVPVVWAEVMTFGEQDRQLTYRTEGLRPKR